jgi:hypothetical protein
MCMAARPAYGCGRFAAIHGSAVELNRRNLQSPQHLAAAPAPATSRMAATVSQPYAFATMDVMQWSGQAGQPVGRSGFDASPATLPIGISTRRRPTSIIHTFALGASTERYDKPKPWSACPAGTPALFARHSNPQNPGAPGHRRSRLVQPAGTATLNLSVRKAVTNRYWTRVAEHRGFVDRFCNVNRISF